MEHEVHVVERPALRVVAKRQQILMEDLSTALPQAFGEVYAMIGAARVETAGPPFIIYHSVPTTGEPLDLEVCAPVADNLMPSDPWRLVELPAGLFVTRLHVGPYDTIGDVYGALWDWIPANGFAVAGPPREVYLSPPSTPPSETRTIVEYPVSRVPAAVG